MTRPHLQTRPDPVPPALAKGEGARSHCRPRSNGGATAPISSNLPAWASNIQARHLLDQLRHADLTIVGGDAPDSGFRYRASYSTIAGAKANRDLKSLRHFADVYAEAVENDYPTLRAFFLTRGPYHHEADALLAEVRGERVRKVEQAA